MKNTCLALIIFFSLPFLISSSPLLNSTSNHVDFSNITRGSSLSMNDTRPYWVSPSGNIAFGFYQLPWSPNQYTVGIWFVKASRKTLVWTANHKHLIPVHKPSSILFTKEGKLVLRIFPDNKEKPLLPDAPETVSYAKLLNNGNFVLYGSDSQIVWESFDYPTDTLLGGQKLNLGDDHLTSNPAKYKLSMGKISGTVVIMDAADRFVADVSIRPGDTPETLPASLNLDTAGMLYLLNSDGSIREIIYGGRNQQQQLEDGTIISNGDGTISNVNGDYIYRAALDSKGHFILYEERIDGNGESSSALVSLWSSNNNPSNNPFNHGNKLAIFGFSASNPMVLILSTLIMALV